MPRKTPPSEHATPKTTGQWIVRGVPVDVMRKMRAVANMQGKPLKRLLIELAEAYLKHLEERGQLPTSAPHYLKLEWGTPLPEKARKPKRSGS